MGWYFFLHTGHVSTKSKGAGNLFNFRIPCRTYIYKILMGLYSFLMWWYLPLHTGHVSTKSKGAGNSYNFRIPCATYIYDILMGWFFLQIFKMY